MFHSFLGGYDKVDRGCLATDNNNIPPSEHRGSGVEILERRDPSYGCAKASVYGGTVHTKGNRHRRLSKESPHRTKDKKSI